MNQKFTQIQLMSIVKIKPHSGNETIYLTADVSELVKSLDLLKEMLEPIIITVSGTILSGHRRYKAALQLGWEEVPVRIVDIPEQHELIYLIAANSYRQKTWGEKAAELTAIATYADTYGKKEFVKFLGKEDSELTLRQQIAEIVGLCEVYVSRLQKIVETNDSFIPMIDAGEISFNRAYNACVKGQAVVPQPKTPKTKGDEVKVFCTACPNNKNNFTNG